MILFGFFTIMPMHIDWTFFIRVVQPGIRLDRLLQSFTECLISKIDNFELVGSFLHVLDSQPALSDQHL